MAARTSIVAAMFAGPDGAVAPAAIARLPCGKPLHGADGELLVCVAANLLLDGLGNDRQCGGRAGRGERRSGELSNPMSRRHPQREQFVPCGLESGKQGREVDHFYPTIHRASQLRLRSGTTTCSGRPIFANSDSTARYPLRTAPSIVAGQSVAVQSPARYSPAIGVC